MKKTIDPIVAGAGVAKAQVAKEATESEIIEYVEKSTKEPTFGAALKAAIEAKVKERDS